MANVTLLVSKTCSACPSAKTLWKAMKVKYSFSYREIDIGSDAGQELAERHSIRAVPATIINGRLTFIGVPPRESAEKAIKAKAQSKPKKEEEADPV
jgi:glutaredoxin